MLKKQILLNHINVKYFYMSKLFLFAFCKSEINFLVHVLQKGMLKPCTWSEPVLSTD